MAASSGELAFAREDPRLADVHVLVDRHLAFANDVTPPAHVHALGVEQLLGPEVAVHTVRRDGVLLGIGALARLDASHVELKSMHVDRAARGQGIGGALLSHLLDVATAEGYRRVSLETGAMAAFAPARALYRAFGFVPCEPFGDHTASSISTCLTLELA